MGSYRLFAIGLFLMLLQGPLTGPSVQAANGSNPTDPVEDSGQELSSEMEEIRVLFGISEEDGESEFPKPPLIEHEPPELFQADQSLTIWAKVTDDSDDYVVHVFYRALGTGENFRSLTMNREEENRFTARIPATRLTTHGLEYYIQAMDGEGNRSLSISDPSSPHLLDVEQKVNVAGWMLFAAALILIPVVTIRLQRRFTKVRREARSRHLRGFVERQRELEQARRKLYERHLRAIRGQRAGDTPPDRGDEATAPPTKKKAKPSTSRPKPAATAPKERPLDALIMDLEQKLESEEIAQPAKFDLAAEARSLLEHLETPDEASGGEPKPEA